MKLSLLQGDDARAQERRSSHISLEGAHGWPQAEPRDASSRLSHGFPLIKRERKADGTGVFGHHPLSQWISKHKAKWGGSRVGLGVQERVPNT